MIANDTIEHLDVLGNYKISIDPGLIVYKIFDYSAQWDNNPNFIIPNSNLVFTNYPVIPKHIPELLEPFSSTGYGIKKSKRKTRKYKHLSNKNKEEGKQRGRKTNGKKTQGKKTQGKKTKGKQKKRKRKRKRKTS